MTKIVLVVDYKRTSQSARILLTYSPTDVESSEFPAEIRIEIEPHSVSVQGERLWQILVNLLVVQVVVPFHVHQGSGPDGQLVFALLEGQVVQGQLELFGVRAADEVRARLGLRVVGWVILGGQNACLLAVEVSVGIRAGISLP